MDTKFKSPIATRHLARIDTGAAVTVQLGLPRGRRTGEFECPYRVRGLGRAKIGRALGEDSVQALQLAFEAVRLELEPHAAILTWYQHMNHRFGGRVPEPVTPCARVLSRLIRYVWALPNTLIGLLFVPTAMLPRGRMQVIDGVLEAHGPLISAILRHCVPIPSGASAITFGHVVLARDSWSLDATRAHERVHVRQCEIWGPAFIPAYLIAGLWGLMTGTGAYTGNYFERQAKQSARGDRENWR